MIHKKIFSFKVYSLNETDANVAIIRKAKPMNIVSKPNPFAEEKMLSYFR